MQLSRRHFVSALLATTTLGTAPARAIAGKGPRPNIITIVLDDVGYSDIGCFGSEIRTPVIDSLAKTGLRYVHFDTKAVCASTRAAMLTGRNAHTVNMPDVPDVAAVTPDDPQMARLFRLPGNAQTMAQALQRRGYATWAIGKWLSVGVTMTSYVSALPIWNSSTVTGRTYCPSVATTLSFRPGMRTLKMVCAAALMKRRRTRSPGVKRPVQLSAGPRPLTRKE